MKMKAKYIITLENKQEIEAARKKNKDKNVEKRLLALSLRSDGKTLREIAEITGYNCRYVGDLVEKYRKNGLAAITENHYHIPPYTPETNPIEQIWKELRKRGFRNEIFATLNKVVERLCDTICSLKRSDIQSITARK